MGDGADRTIAELRVIVDGDGPAGPRADASCKLLADAIGFERAWLVWRDGEQLRTIGGVAMVLADPRHPPLPIDKGIVGRCARENVTLRFHDVASSPDYCAATALTRSELAVPLARDGRAVGVINCEANRLAAFDDEAQALVERAARLLVRLIPDAV